MPNMGTNSFLHTLFERDRSHLHLVIFLFINTTGLHSPQREIRHLDDGEINILSVQAVIMFVYCLRSATYDGSRIPHFSTPIAKTREEKMKDSGILATLT